MPINPMNSEAPSEQKSSVEGPAWEGIHGTWQQVHGGIFDQGFSLEWHDFHLSENLDWAKSFHEDTLEICLNFNGNAILGAGKAARSLEPSQVALFTTSKSPLIAQRSADSAHRFITLEVSRAFLGQQFSASMDALKPQVREFLDSSTTGGEAECLPLAPSLLPLRMHLLAPPVFPSAQPTWYQSKILELLAATVFKENRSNELFCHQHLRLNRERVEHARFLLQRDLENPPDLNMLAAELGCSAFHLSRIFAKECGISIPRYLRMERIEKAAEMLRAGQNTSVTDAATAVGYSSLSAFIKAFVEHFKMLPSEYIVRNSKA